MKKLKITLAIAAISFFTFSAFGQRVKKTSGDENILKSESSINIEFNYDNIQVGKYKTEQEYITAKTAEYNKKEAGKGDSWAKSWANDKESRFEPKFIELFTRESGMTVSKDAKYTLIFKTTSIEPGYNIGISRKNAEIDAEVWIVETANKDNKLATFTISNVPGGTAFGYDFDTGLRISEAYANAGKKLGKYLK
ncbi:MAG: hypothetical protein R2765_02650 [Ferruginibacter sp.]|nr:hypothetical protein [Bacteroidota bacterium]MBX2918255.1 hypothetical protein [Ferruginibacter sp.]MCB0708122.1 hypothetical protein [Chitinophagaceae bacterium]MCC7378085.1 hypothetical protein [Chitinophagaceae bacterium]